MKIKDKIIEKIESLLKPGIMLILLSLFMISTVAGLSDPINQSLSEFNNLTRADNVLEITQEINVWVGGLFGITILILVFAVSFIMTLFFRNDMANAFLFSSFITTVLAVLLFVVSLVPDQAVFFTVPLFLLSIVYAVISK